MTALPQTVLLLTPSVRMLGARRSLVALATTLNRERWRPIVLAKEEGAMTEILRQAGVETHILHFRPYRKGKFFLFRPFTVARLRRIARREKAALIHCNEIYPNPYAVRAARPLGIPVVTHMRLSVTERMTHNYRLHEADRIIVVSDAAGRDFDHWPDKDQKVQTVYNGMNLDDFRPDPEGRAEWRRRWAVADDELLFGMLGLISERKQQHVALEALARLRGQGAPVRLVIVGDVSPRESAYERQLHDRVKALGLEGVVRFEPFQDNPVPLFAALDANLLISNDEGFGRVVIESGALGIPTIGSRAGGIPELIEPQQDGLLVAVGSVDQLVQAMAALTATETRQRLGQAMNAKVRARFTIQHHTRQMEAVYQEVLDARRKTGTSGTP